MRKNNLLFPFVALIGFLLSSCRPQFEHFSYGYAAVSHPFWSLIHNEVMSASFGSSHASAPSAQPPQAPYVMKEAGRGYENTAFSYAPKYMAKKALILGGFSFNVLFEDDHAWLPSQNFGREAVGTWAIVCLEFPSSAGNENPFWSENYVVTVSDGETVVGTLCHFWLRRFVQQGDGEFVSLGNGFQESLLFSEYMDDPLSYIDWDSTMTLTDSPSLLYRTIGTYGPSGTAMNLALYKDPGSDAPFTNGVYWFGGATGSYESVSFDAVSGSPDSGTVLYQAIQKEINLFRLLGILADASDNWRYPE